MQDRHDAGVVLFAWVKPRMLWRPSLTVTMPPGQGAVANAPSTDPRLIVRRFKMIGEQEEHMNGPVFRNGGRPASIVGEKDVVLARVHPADRRYGVEQAEEHDGDGRQAPPID